MLLEVVEDDPPRRLVGRIVDTGAPFGGSWTYQVTPVDGGSRVSVTEDGWVSNPIFRFMARFVFGYHSTLDSYLRALGRRFGDG